MSTSVNSVNTLDIYINAKTEAAIKATEKLGDSAIKLGANADRLSAKLESAFNHGAVAVRNLNQTLGAVNKTIWFFQSYLAAPLQSFIQTNAEMERSLKLMKGMRSEADDLGKTLGAIGDKNFVIDMAKKAPFEIGAIQDAFVKMKSAGLDPTNGSLNALINSVARFGGDSELLKRAAIAIQQMAGKGVVSMEELRQQLGEAIPDAMMAMAESMKVDLGEFVKLVSTGSVEAKNALDNMFLLMEYRSHGAADEMMKTWSGSVAKLKTEWNVFQEELMVKSGLESIFSDAIKQFSEGVKTEDFKNFTQGVASGIGTLARVASEGVKIIYEFKDEIIALGTGLLALKGFDSLSKGFEMVAEKGRGATGIVSNFWNRINQTTLTPEGRETAQKLTKEIANLNKEKELWEDQVRLKKEKLAEEEALIVENNLKIYQYELEKKQKLLQEQQSYYNESIAKMQEYQAKMAQAKAAGNMAQYGAYKTNASKEEKKAGFYSKEYAATAAEVGELSTKVSECEQKLQQLGRVTQQTNAITEQEAVAAKQAAEAHTANADAIKEEIAAKKDDIELKEKQVEGLEKEREKTDALSQSKNWLDEKLNSLISSGWNFVKGLGAMGVQMAAIEAVVWTLGKAYAALQQWIETNINRTTTLLQLQREALRGFADLAGLAKTKATIASAEREKEYVKGNRLGFLESFTLGMGSGGDSYTMWSGDSEKRIKELDEIIKLGEDTKKRQNYIIGQNETREKMSRIEQDKEMNLGSIRDKYYREYGNEFSPKSNPEAWKNYQAERKNAENLAALQRRGLENQLSLQGTLGNDDAKNYSTGGLMAIRGQSGNSITNASGEIQNISGKNKNGKTKGGSKKSKGGGFQKDTYSDFVQSISSEAAKLTAENEALAKGVIDYEDIEKKARAIVTGKVSDGKNGKKDWSDGQIENAVKLQVALLKQQDANKLLKTSTEDLVKSEEELKVVGIETDSGFTSLSSTMQSLTKKYAVLDMRVASLNDKQKETYEENKKQTILNQLLIEDKKRLAEYTEKLKVTEEGYINNSVLQRLTSLKNAVQEVTKARDAQILKLREQGASAEQIQERIKGFDVQLRDVILKNTSANASALDQLRNKWANVTGQMETLTANWSQSFSDNLVEAINGGEVSWRDFLRSMLVDMQKALVQKAFGGAITGMFGMIGAPFSSLFDSFGNSPLATNGMATPQVDITSASVIVNGQTITGMGDSAIGGWDWKNKDPYADSLDKMTGEVKEATTGFSWLGEKLTGFGETAMSIGTNILGGAETLVGGFGSAANTMLNSAGNFASSIGQIIGSQFQTGGIFSAGGWFFANGGIMTGKGALPLKAYAGGGIANSPQLAVFGEGAKPEAFVPLPDGRSIPVTLTGNRGMGGSYTPVSIQINVDNNGAGSQTASGGSGNDSQNQMWSELAQRIKGMVVEEINTQKRPGGVLY